MMAADANPYATERAICNVLLPSGSAVRCGLPVSVAGEHVGHGYCLSFRVTKPLPSQVGQRSSLDVIELSPRGDEPYVLLLLGPADLERGAEGIGAYAAKV
jgi:hypothetical protein